MSPIYKGRRWLWISSVCSISSLLLALWLGFEVMMAFALIAPFVNMLPLILVLWLGTGFSVWGLFIGIRRRATGFALTNLVSLCGHVLGLVIFILPLTTAVNQTFILPNGYSGAVAIVFLGSEPETELTFDIPASGILVTF